MKIENGGNGIGFYGILATAFVVLKLTHVIEWSWWWVFSPVWIPLAAVSFKFGLFHLFLQILKDDWH